MWFREIPQKRFKTVRSMSHVNSRSRCAILVATVTALLGRFTLFADELIRNEPHPSGAVVRETPESRIALPDCQLSVSMSVCCLDDGQPTMACPIRPGDEVWLVCTRHQDCQNCAGLCVHRYDCGIGWVPSSTDEYFGTADPGMTVTTYVHGNRIDAQTACDRGFKMYTHLAQAAGPDQRIRHVIWSWPSSTVLGPVRDVRIKASKTYLQSYLFADFICEHEPLTNVGLIGFSFGARIIVGAQHLLGGGHVLEHQLESHRCEQAPRTRVAIWAPAMPADWIHPAGFNGRAVTSVDRFLVYFNSRDPLLRFYRRKLGESAADALGYRGICLESLGIYASTVEQFNAAEAVGPHHKWSRYNAADEVIAHTAHFALWSDLR